jgi:hypothetical protein
MCFIFRARLCFLRCLNVSNEGSSKIVKSIFINYRSPCYANSRIVIKAMGAAMGKGLWVASGLESRGYNVSLLTGSVEVWDDLVPIDATRVDLEVSSQQRFQSVLVMTVSL